MLATSGSSLLSFIASRLGDVPHLRRARRVAREDPGTRGAPSGGVVLPTAGCAENLAPGSTERSARREQKAQDLETAV